MDFEKKTVLLKQVSNGFSANGKPVVGVVNYYCANGKLFVDAYILNLKVLDVGEYEFKIFSDNFYSGKKLGGSVFSVSAEFTTVESNFDIDFIFMYGDGKTLKTVAFADGLKKHSASFYEDFFNEKNEVKPQEFNDELLAEENYYEYDKRLNFEQPVSLNNDENEEKGLNIDEKFTENSKDEHTDEKNQEEKEEKFFDADVPFDEGVFGGKGENFYESVKTDIESAFDLYEKDEYLTEVIPNSKFCKVTGNQEFSFGVVYDDGKPKHVCYALKGEYKKEPPTEIKGLASFVPKSIYDDSGDGYWVIFQDATTGESIKT